MWHLLQSHWPGFGEPWKSTVFSRGKTQLHWLFSNPPKSSAHTSGAWRHSHPQVLSGIFILISLNDTSSPRVRSWTPALMLHLTNPCTKRKVLSLIKPKGKIYKTKYLGHYITLRRFLIPEFNYFLIFDFNHRYFQTSIAFFKRHFLFVYSYLFARSYDIEYFSLIQKFMQNYFYLFINYWYATKWFFVTYTNNIQKTIKAYVTES